MTEAHFAIAFSTIALFAALQVLSWAIDELNEARRVREQIKELNAHWREAIALFSYGAHQEAIDVLRRRSMHTGKQEESQ